MASNTTETKSGIAGVIHGFTRFNYILSYIAGVFILIAMLITTYEVIARFGFNSPTKWTQDFSNYLLLLSIWFSTAYVMLLDAHIKVTILVERIPVKARAILTAIMYVMGLIYAVVLTWITAGETYRAFMGNWLPEGYYKFVLYPLYAVICIGSLLLSLAIIERIYNNIQIARHPELHKEDDHLLMPSSQEQVISLDEM